MKFNNLKSQNALTQLLFDILFLELETLTMLFKPRTPDSTDGKKANFTEGSANNNGTAWQDDWNANKVRHRSFCKVTESTSI